MAERCECHECTQARWKASIQGQIEMTVQPQRVSRSVSVRNVCLGLRGITLTPEEAQEIITQVRYSTHGDIPCLK